MEDIVGRTRGLYRSRIDAQDEADLIDWAKRLNVAPQRLKDAIARVGNWSDDVQFELNRSRAPAGWTAA